MVHAPTVTVLHLLVHASQPFAPGSVAHSSPYSPDRRRPQAPPPPLRRRAPRPPSRPQQTLTPTPSPRPRPAARPLPLPPPLAPRAACSALPRPACWRCCGWQVLPLKLLLLPASLLLVRAIGGCAAGQLLGCAAARAAGTAPLHSAARATTTSQRSRGRSISISKRRSCVYKYPLPKPHAIHAAGRSQISRMVEKCSGGHAWKGRLLYRMSNRLSRWNGVREFERGTPVVLSGGSHARDRASLPQVPHAHHPPKSSPVGVLPLPSHTASKEKRS
jgi:hypothetical protein